MRTLGPLRRLHTFRLLRDEGRWLPGGDWLALERRAAARRT
jgi:hypothetical protein